ncbi:hypothetical protein [Sandaracinus amylolyticus]|uniref:hypothetical protein n=1 Tax=Sandaracinus amylolyticus TaxID=927083 RepID=UPI001F30B420|nr:hypothetical protein [Sandaracinus amylolyticus]
MSTPRPPRAIVLLGAQRFDPTLGAAAAELGLDGPIATITAGWQEREGEDSDLHEHLGKRTINLRLHRRADEIFRADPELHAAHRKKQERLRHKQDFYRIRLEHELDANHVIRQRKAPPEILAEEEAAAIGAIRLLDEYHLGQCAKVESEFDAAWRPFERDSIARHRHEIAEILRDTVALAIAGGHVATLLNRLRLFGVAELIDGQAVLAWSAGAMAISDRVVLFHDSPPQGPGASEVLDRGLGLCSGVVPLPHPETRLRLDDAERVALLARRFAPARCLAMPAGARITYREGRFGSPHRVLRLSIDGTRSPVQPTDDLLPEASS